MNQLCPVMLDIMIWTARLNLRILAMTDTTPEMVVDTTYTKI